MREPLTPLATSSPPGHTLSQVPIPKPSHPTVTLDLSLSIADYRSQLWEANPHIHSILTASNDLEQVRDGLFRYLEQRERQLLGLSHSGPRVLRILSSHAVRVFKNIIGPFNEARTGVSALSTLIELAHSDPVSPAVSPGFLMEFTHLFKAVGGHPDLHGGPFSGDYVAEFLGASGREAARARSRVLDRWAGLMRRTVARYPSGLDPQVREVRARNRARIREVFGCSKEEWNTHTWQVRHVIRDAEALGALVALTREEREAVEQAHAHGVPFGITPYYVSLMDPTPTEFDHAIRAQVLPPRDYVSCMIEYETVRSTAMDFMGEHDTSPVDLVTRRYPEIAILKPFNTCAQICVYCQRNWEIDNVLSPRAMAAWKRIDEALSWLDDHRGVREVLVTGGDPCLMADATIYRLMERLAERPQISRIRIGSRTPVVLPMRWTDDLVGILSQFHEPGTREVAVVTHFEHSYEITPEAMGAVQRIRQAGMGVYNQEVFSVENSRRFETVKLRRDLRLIGIDPYYTFNMKGKAELKRYRVPIARLIQERREEARLAPGLDRTDEPVFNIPRLGKSHLRAGQDHRVIMIKPDGTRIYEFDPWEKGFAPIPTYVFTDVPIFEYLVEMMNRGEDPQDYASIWYYY